mmetsp:Transcript_72851/g.122090  ORF Transcript_72851/g.122090 Transcript_72851/m.122090 type:complete len:80 (+) Transcript_72851:1030-1269(+)
MCSASRAVTSQGPRRRKPGAGSILNPDVNGPKLCNMLSFPTNQTFTCTLKGFLKKPVSRTDCHAPVERIWGTLPNRHGF